MLRLIITANRRKLTEHESTKGSVIWAPDSKQFAYVTANTLFIYNVETNTNTRLAYNQAGGFSVREFSKDGKWLALSHSDADQNSDVYLYDITARQEYNISQNPFRDSGGILTNDGKKVIFTSNRDNGTNHLFVVPLEKVKENPNDPLVKERLKKEEQEKGEEEFAVSIEMDGIDRRAIQLTRGSNGA
ncbi:hypothetical protein AMJ80_03230, partial [bacterium SM23_31]